MLRLLQQRGQLLLPFLGIRQLFCKYDLLPADGDELHLLLLQLPCTFGLPGPGLRQLTFQLELPFLHLLNLPFKLLAAVFAVQCQVPLDLCLLHTLRELLVALLRDSGPLLFLKEPLPQLALALLCAGEALG